MSKIIKIVRRVDKAFNKVETHANKFGLTGKGAAMKLHRVIGYGGGKANAQKQNVQNIKLPKTGYHVKSLKLNYRLVDDF